MNLSITKMQLKSLVVVGGTGFLGKDLLKYGLNHYKSVTAISRNRPKWDSWWQSKIHFPLIPLQDLFSTIDNAVEPNSRKNKDYLNADTVIYSVGTLFASSLYKDIINNQDMTLVPKWIRQEIQFQSNGAPLYDTLHYQYPIQVFNTFKQECKSEDPYFVYISAHSSFEDLPYIKTKRLAEDFLLNQSHKTAKNHDIKVLVVRPGLLYNEDRPISMLMAAGNQLLSCPLGISAPLRTSQVAEGIYTAINQNQSGILEIGHLQELSK
eukprot:NODE_29_length_33183_cov_0.333666.p9 type:complete len:266 gc:universal NODE_29_length_33183_cov_0.333666:26931-27728(+)